MRFPSSALRSVLLLVLTSLLIVPPSLAQTGQPTHVTATALQPTTMPESEKPWLYKGSDIPPNPAWTFGVLPNGLRYAVRHNGVPPGQVAIRVRIDAGSLMEKDSERGYAHLLEHLAFRGSEYAGDMESKRIWQRLGVTFGSDTNAATTFTDTVFKLDLPSATETSLDESMHILAGMMRAPDLDQAALDAERPVVLAEQRERPGPQIRFDKVTRGLFFDGQPLADRAPIGTTKTLQAATPASVRAFHDRWYRPSRAVIVIAGDMDPALFEAMIKKHFGAWQGKGRDPKTPDFGSPHPGAPFAATVSEANFPPIVAMAYLRPWTIGDDTILFNQRRMVDQIAVRIVNRRLERRARAGGSFIRASASLDDVARSANVTTVNVLPMDGDWKAALHDVRAVIADARRHPPTQAEIDREVEEIKAAMVRAVAGARIEAGAVQADTMVEAVDVHETTGSPDISLGILQGAIDKHFFTPDRILAASKKVFDGVALRGVLNSPEADPGARKALADALTEDITDIASARAKSSTVTFDDLPAFGAPGTVESRSPILANPPIEKVVFSNGVNLLLFANPAETNRAFVSVRFGHGYNAIPADHMTPAWAGEIALAASGIGDLGVDELEQLTGDREIDLDFSIADDAFVFAGQTTPADVADQLRLIAAKLAHPGWDPNPVNRARAMTLAGYDAMTSSPEGVLTRDLAGLLHDGDPRWATPSREQVAALTPESFRSFWEPVLARGPIEVQVYGDIEPDKVISAVARTFGAMKPRPGTPIDPPAVRFPDHAADPVVRHHSGAKDQAAAVIAWPTGGGSAAIGESRRLEILSAIFGDRMLDELRSEAGVSYTPQVASQWPIGLASGGDILAVGMVPPDKTDLFFSIARRIAADLVANPVSQDELSRALQPMKQYLMRASTGSSFWMRQTAGGAFDPNRIAGVNSIVADYGQTRPADIQALARKYLVPSKDWTMVVLPDEAEKP
ncbi:M16 family metallopeptidase [Stakelama saccharophila]|uniref:Insulinase family protein n=1 Tax=Stakelama saccharophila TaxID=3075605 RepID=A0ABZ0BAU4_9SPHN|nr:insulinase family protein [Stakelama sp. W311]WNO54478.1 insulinase family protein [Stakelama sp. W311]